ncbi:BlaI/MecI/CopY family transcriptional regulator [bacterium]|nr:BlaI/MecI/CopY family transcriptional regulator [bacterium]
MASNLNPNDLEIMHVLWQHGPLKPADIEQHLSTPTKNAALRWQLRTLMEKGHVTRRKIGKAFFYQAATSQGRAFEKFARRLINVFGGGSAVAFVGRMIDLELMSPKDIEQLRNYASESGEDSGKTRKKGA